MHNSLGHSWTIKKTFVELLDDDSPDCENEPGLKRSSSDSVLSSNTSSLTPTSPPYSQEGLLNWPPSQPVSEGKLKGGSNSENSGSDQHKGTHLTWASSSDSGDPGWNRSLQGGSHDDSPDRVGLGGRNNSEDQTGRTKVKPQDFDDGFDHDQALAVYKELLDLTESGADIRDAISEKFAGVNIKQYVPQDPDTGEYYSLGSVLHFTNECRRCSFFDRGSCRKEEICLFCHAPHDGRVFRIRKSKKHRSRMHLKQSRQQWEADEHCQAENVRLPHQDLLPNGTSGSQSQAPWNRNGDFLANQPYTPNRLPFSSTRISL